MWSVVVSLYSGSDSANFTAGLGQHATRSHGSLEIGFEKLGVVNYHHFGVFEPHPVDGVAKFSRKFEEVRD
jgi:hypothetical protein